MNKNRITRPRKPEEHKLIFTEGLDYFKTGKTSIWGKGDKATLQLLNRIDIHGRWLNLTAGDGRYNVDLLRRVDHVIASDIDASALSKLWPTTPQKYRKKLDTKVFNVTKKFPFKRNSFDGVFSTGTLHLFPRSVLKKIFLEIDRVLKPNGKIILDFATDVRRTAPDGKPLVFGNEPQYRLAEAKKILRQILKDYQLGLSVSEVIEDFQRANPPYTLSCKFVLLVADKKSSSRINIKRPAKII